MRTLLFICCAICLCNAKCPATGNIPITNDKALCEKYDSWAANCGGHYVVGDKCYCDTENRRCVSMDGSKNWMDGKDVEDAIYKIMSQNQGGSCYRWQDLVNEYGRYRFHNDCDDDYHCCMEICNEIEGCIAVQTDSTYNRAHWYEREGWCYFISKCDKWVSWKPGPGHTFGTYYTDKATHDYGEVLEEEEEEEEEGGVSMIMDVNNSTIIVSTVYIVVACLFLGIGVYFGSKLTTKPKSVQIN